MSPNSSSTCLTGRNVRSAALRTILPLLLRLRSVVWRTLRHASAACHPPATAVVRRPGTVRHDRWYRGPIVWGRPVFPVILSGAPSRRARRTRATLAGGCERRARGGRGPVRERMRRRHAPGRERTQAQLQAGRRPRELRPRSVDRTPRHAAADGAQQRHPHGPERGGHDRLLRIRLEIPRTGRRQATDLDHRRRPRGHPPRRADPPWSARPGAGRPLREHLGARPARARAPRARSAGGSLR